MSGSQGALTLFAAGDYYRIELHIAASRGTHCRFEYRIEELVAHILVEIFTDRASAREVCQIHGQIRCLDGYG